jgi:hypothetical protein
LHALLPGVDITGLVEGRMWRAVHQRTDLQIVAPA